MSRTGKRVRRETVAESVTPKRRRFLVLTWAPLLIVVAGSLAYLSSFHGAFVFDDKVHIHAGTRIRSLSDLTHLLAGRRPVVDVTLALNYALGGLDPWGYHALNLLFHLGVALMLYAVLRRSVTLVCRAESSDARLRWWPLAVTLLWVVHPLTSQAVTYVIQRGESLMSFFYLATIYCVLRGDSSRRRILWYWAAVIACLLGLASKAVMITVPVAVLLYDRTFLTNSFSDAWRRRWPLYLALLGTCAFLFLNGLVQGIFSTAPRGSTSVGFGFKGITALEYACTQPGVLLYYLRLAIYPHPLCFDYAWPVARSVFAIAVPMAAVVLMLAGTVWAIVRRSFIGFVAAVFFLILAPTSSIIPIRDPLVEHRMYLPLAAVITLMVLAWRAVLRQIVKWGPLREVYMSQVSGVVTILLVSTLGVLTFQRNNVYVTDAALWRDVTTKRPDNARAFLNLATATADRVEAIHALQRAVAIDPSYADAYFNLGQAYRAAGRLQDAADAYRRTASLDRSLAAPAQLDLGIVLTDMGKPDEGARAFEACVAIDPANYKAHFNLGNHEARRGRYVQAVGHFERAIEAQPGFPQSYVNLARVLQRQGKPDEACDRLKAAISVVPENARAVLHLQLARILASREDLEGAASHYERVLQIDPANQAARRELAGLRNP